MVATLRTIIIGMIVFSVFVMALADFARDFSGANNIAVDDNIRETWDLANQSMYNASLVGIQMQGAADTNPGVTESSTGFTVVSSVMYSIIKFPFQAIPAAWSAINSLLLNWGVPGYVVYAISGIIFAIFAFAVLSVLFRIYT
jgi:hypothetical protein